MEKNKEQTIIAAKEPCPRRADWEQCPRRADWEEARPRASVPSERADMAASEVSEADWEEARPRASVPSERASRVASSTDGFLRKYDSLLIHGSKLPHWNQDETYVFFTFRLRDSIPKSIAIQLKSELDNWLSTHPKPWDEKAATEYHNLFPNRIEELIDNGHGSCILQNPEAAEIVESVLLHDDGAKYYLCSYVIMPNHVHALVRLLEDIKIESLIQTWKSITSHKLRKRFGQSWCRWMKNYHDRTIRDETHFQNVLAYILKNYSHGGIALGGHLTAKS